MSPENGSGNVTSQSVELLTITIDGKPWKGIVGEEHEIITVRSEQDDIYEVRICAPGEDRPSEELGPLPHLRRYQSVLSGESSRVFECFAPLYHNDLRPLADVLFANTPMDLERRLKLSLSLAAAGYELETLMHVRPLRRLILDAFLVDTVSFPVTLDIEQLLREPDEEETACAYRKMLFLGVMPPECCEDPGLPPVSVEALRHILAVLLFRTMTGADPFDGEDTYFLYPFRTEASVRKIYGRQAKYVADGDNGDNRTNPFIGGGVAGVLGRIFPTFRAPFAAAFRDGVAAPERRPSALALLNNQCRMLEGFCIYENDWRIFDPSAENGCPEGLPWIRTANGTTATLFHLRPLYQYMFSESVIPVDDTLAGRIALRQDGPTIQFVDSEKAPVRLSSESVSVEGSECTILRKPWLSGAEATNDGR